MEYYGTPSSQFVPRALFVFLFFLSIAIPFVPILLFIQRPWWTFGILAACLVFSISSLTEARSRPARPVTNLERFLVVVASLFGNSAIAFVAAWGFILVKVLASWLAWSSLFMRILWGVAIANVCFFLLSALLTAGPALLEAFFPKTGVGNASLFPGFAWPKVAWQSVAGVLTIVLLAYLGRVAWPYAYLAIILVLMIVSAPVSTAFDRQKVRTTASPPPLEAIKALLNASGYVIAERLQTGEVALDRLIAVFDLVAHKEGHALAIVFKTSASGVDAAVASTSASKSISSEYPTSEGERDKPLTWTVASSLRTAIWAIYKGAEKQKVKMASIQPLLILFGRTADASLVEFCKSESIGLVVLPETAPLEGIAKGQFSPEQMRMFAREYLELNLDSYVMQQAPPGLATESPA